MDEIKTFGNLLSFCIDLENKAQNFYLEISNNEVNKALNELFLKLAEQNNDRRLLLERIRRENINEMILQSIEGLKPKINFDRLNIKNDFEPINIIEKSMIFERSCSQFYLDAVNKANLILAEAGRYFKKLAKRKDSRMLELKLIYEELGI